MDATRLWTCARRFGTGPESGSSLGQSYDIGPLRTPVAVAVAVGVGRVQGDLSGAPWHAERSPIPRSTLDQLDSRLRGHFSALSPGQGIRLRSSSSVEDIEGFNGAGLYESHTAYLDERPVEADGGLAYALRRVWSSYWSSEAFEERALAAIDHPSGHMAVLVHPRFDDTHELANGVLTLMRWPAVAGQPIRYSLEYNSQRGSESVTNPSTLHLPERLQLEAAGATIIQLTRVAESTLPPVGHWVLSESEVLELFDQGRRVAEDWLAWANRTVSPSAAQRVLSLDFEHRAMAAGWPALASGAQNPAQLVLEQACTLEFRP